MELPIISINTAAVIWMVLPGKPAAIFRKTIADIFIRVLDGDPRLSDAIRDIGEFNETLPETHPLKKQSSVTLAFSDLLSKFSTKIMQSVHNEINSTTFLENIKTTLIQQPLDHHRYISELKDIVPDRLKQLEGEVQNLQKERNEHTKKVNDLEQDNAKFQAIISGYSQLIHNSKERKFTKKRKRAELVQTLHNQIAIFSQIDHSDSE